MKTPTPRIIAQAAGLKRYEGLPCIQCGGTTRLVSNQQCIPCRRQRKYLDRKKKQQYTSRGRPPKHLAFVGPIKPRKKHETKPITDFDFWVRRSRNNKKSKLRKALTREIYMNLYVSHCPLLGLELTYAKYEGNTPDNYASLDKIDPSKGYIEGNVQILSFRANTIKGHATLEELKLIVDNWTKQNDKNK
jgi:hypothetical protein